MIHKSLDVSAMTLDWVSETRDAMFENLTRNERYLLYLLYARSIDVAVTSPGVDCTPSLLARTVFLQQFREEGTEKEPPPTSLAGSLAGLARFFLKLSTFEAETEMIAGSIGQVLADPEVDLRSCHRRMAEG